MQNPTIEVNWMPVPGFTVAVLALVVLLVALAAYGKPWAPRVGAFAGAACVAGVAAMLIGVGLGVHLGASS